MSHGIILGFFVIALAGTAASTPAASPVPASRWMHVKVDQTVPEKETVRINMPLRLVADLLPLIEDGKFHKGHVSLDSLSVREVDLRKMLDLVRGAEDGEYVTADTPKETVRITKKDGLLLIRVHEAGEQGEDVQIKVRMDVLAALTSAQPDELDIVAAVEALGAEEADLITVNGPDETVHIWVDDRPASD